MKAHVKDLKNNMYTSVFLGSDIEWAKSQGYEEKEVEIGYDRYFYSIGNAPSKPLEEIKEEKLQEIKTAFATIEDSGYTMSSLGYRVDATKKSLEDVQGLIKLAESNMISMPVQFRDYDNKFHACTLGDLKTLEIEIIAHGVTVYGEKWQLEFAVESATTKEQVEVVDPHSMSGYDWEIAKTPTITSDGELVIEPLM